MRHYRILKGYSATQFGELYGQALGGEAKTRICVLTMERTNNVPTAITRRRTIADLLGIPYVLFGLSETLTKTPLFEDTPDQVGGTNTRETPRVPKRETLIRQVLTEHEQALTTYFNGFYHRHGHAVLSEVTGATQEISLWLPNTREYTHQRGKILITQYNRFGAKIAREQQRYDLAISHADKAIEQAEAVHKSKPTSDLMALAFSGRGRASFEQECTRINQPMNYHAAIPFIDAAFSHAQSATSAINGFISLEWSLIHAYAVTSEKEKRKVRERLMAAYNAASVYREEDDIYALKYNPSWYHLAYAEALIALREYTDAIGELDVAEELTPLNLPRRFAFIDAFRAMAYLGLGEFEEAIEHARDALIESKAVKSEYNIARIAKVYRELRKKYKHASSLTELGRELAKTHPHLV